MSLFDNLKWKKKKSIRQLMGAKYISEHSLETYTQGELVFFIIKPQNLAVLSNENIQYKLHSLTTVLKSVESLQWICQNSRESFEHNKYFLKERISKEESAAVRGLCEMDIDFLDKIQMQMATSREFALVLRFKNHKSDEMFNQINRFEKLLKEQGFEMRRADKADIQRMMAVYFEQNITQMEFDDVDGGRWVGMLEKGL